MSAAPRSLTGGRANERALDRPAKRLSVSEVLSLMLSKSGSASETVTLRMNAKGETQPEVVAVAHDGETLVNAARRAALVYDELLGKYPAPGAGSGGKAS